MTSILLFFSVFHANGRSPILGGNRRADVSAVRVEDSHRLANNASPAIHSNQGFGVATSKFKQACTVRILMKAVNFTTDWTGAESWTTSSRSARTSFWRGRKLYNAPSRRKWRRQASHPCSLRASYYQRPAFLPWPSAAAVAYLSPETSWRTGR